MRPSESLTLNVPVGVSVHNTSSPFLSVIDELDGSFQGLSGFVHDAVTNLDTTGATRRRKTVF